MNLSPLKKRRSRIKGLVDKLFGFLTWARSEFEYFVFVNAEKQVEGLFRNKFCFIHAIF